MENDRGRGWRILLALVGTAVFMVWLAPKLWALPIHQHIRPNPFSEEVMWTLHVDVQGKPEPIVPTTPTPSAPIYSSGTCPASLAGESTSPTAVNPSSGASGCIQALPSTWAAYGDPAYASAADAPVSVQMEALNRICAAQGNGAWVAADPC